MLTHWPLFPNDKRHKKYRCVDHNIAKLCEWLWETFKEAQVQSMSEAERQKWFYEKLMPFHWNQMIWSWLKLMPTEGGGKWRTGGRRNHTKWSARFAEGIPSYLMRNQWTGCSWVLHWNWLFLIISTEGTPLCMVKLSGPGAPPPT